MSSLEMFGAILSAKYLEDISYILEKVGIDMKENNKFLKQVEQMSKDKDVQEAVKLEDNIEYRFDLVREEGLEQGLKQGIEKNTIDMIINMINNNVDLETIFKVTNKSIDEIKEIAKTLDKE